MAAVLLRALLIASVFVPAAASRPGRAQTPPTASGSSLAGLYDGSRPEVAARLELRNDGRFRYALAYGALDERAEGRWRLEQDRVVLTSDPVVPPRFVLVDRRPAPGGLIVSLDLPDGLSRQYIHADLRLADGSVVDRQFPEDSPLDLGGDARPATLTLTLPLLDLRGNPVPLPAAAGVTLRFRFEPNDLGKVAFAATPLTLRDGDLILSRHDLQLRFRRFGRK